MGESIAGLAPVVAALEQMGSLAGVVGEPPATAAALDELWAEWGAGADRLQDDLYNLGTITQASAVLYRQTDETAMGGIAP